MDLTCPLRERSDSCADQAALIDTTRQLSYRQLDALVDRLAAQLSARGVRESDRVAIAEPNRIETPALVYALFRIGAIAVLFSVRYPQLMLESLASQINCHFQVTFDSGAPGRLLPEVQQLGYISLTDKSTSHKSLHHRPGINQPATIVFTSGSSGNPRAVLHSFGNHYYNALGSNRNIPMQPGDRWLVSLPLYHVGGLAIFFRCLLGGGATVIADPGDDLVEVIEHHGITHLSVVPAQLKRLLEQLRGSNKQLCRTLKAVLVGGGPVPDQLLARARDESLPVYPTYGLTEMASQVATAPKPDGSLPRLLDFRQVTISAGGEIMVKGDTLFLGYLNGDSVNRAVDKDSWFATGDTGTIDEKGNLAVSGRLDNMFVSGGENIHPELIENGLALIDGIEESVVVPVADPGFGRRPVAFVKCRQSFNSVVIRSTLEENLPRFMIPVAFYPWPDDTPPTGMKPDRAFFRNRASELSGTPATDPD